jgi:hypothetical protein
MVWEFGVAIVASVRTFAQEGKWDNALELKPVSNEDQAANA